MGATLQGSSFRLQMPAPKLIPSPFSQFLNVPIPDQPFPRVNDTNAVASYIHDKVKAVCVHLALNQSAKADRRFSFARRDVDAGFGCSREFRLLQRLTIGSDRFD